jgi:hypothetical protein
MGRQGQRAVLCFCVQRGDVREVRPADHIDPIYGRTLRQAMHSGVEVIAYRAQVTPRQIHLRYGATDATGAIHCFVLPLSFPSGGEAWLQWGIGPAHPWRGALECDPGPVALTRST